MTYRALFTLLFAGLSFGWSSPAMAARGIPCNSCENCSDALSLPASRVFLADDIVHEGEGPCITIKGIQAQFDGLEREIRPLKKEGTVGVLVQAANVLVKNIHVIGAETGVVVDSSRYATLFHLWLENNQTGVRVEPSLGTRISRSVIFGGDTGIDIGGGTDGECSPREQEKRSAFGTVVVGNHIEGHTTGLISCRDIPHLKNNTVTGNKNGVIMKRPKMVQENASSEGPYDSCACAPTLPGVSAGTTLFYSSGCNGCKVHEEWLPDLRSKGADINLRISGPGTQEEAKVFDGHMDRCAPQITDALGIPGCVPNYVCIANDETLKVRAGEDQMVYETQILNADMLEGYAKKCQETADNLYREGNDCVKHVAVNNQFCGNTKTDIEGSAELKKWPGFQNTCNTASEFQDEGKSGCSASCGEVAAKPEKPVARISTAKMPIKPQISKEMGDLKIETPKMDMASLLKDKETKPATSEKETPQESKNSDDGSKSSGPSPVVILLIVLGLATGMYFLSRPKSE